LIAFGGFRVVQPQNSLPVLARHAPVSIQSSETVRKLSIEQPRELSGVAGAARDAQSPDTRSDTGISTPIESNGAQSPRLPTADRSAAPDAGRSLGVLRVCRAGGCKSMASHGHMHSPGKFLASQYRAEAD
jgi:hypothetical protein